MKIHARLDELRHLRDGWLEGKGTASSQVELDWLSRMFEQYFPDDLPLPYIYPTPEGGIQAEWTIGQNEITLEIDLEEHCGNWHCLNMETNAEEVDESLNMDDKQVWEWVTGRISKM